jgi:hypothetical protein
MIRHGWRCGLGLAAGILLLLVDNGRAETIPAHSGEDYLVVDLGQVGEYWNFVHKTAYPQFPTSSMRKHVDVCVAVGFSVEADGVPANISVLRMQTSKADDTEESERMKSAMTDAIARWRFQPSERNAARRPLYTYTVMSMAFSVEGTLSTTAKKHSDAIAKSCEIPEFVSAALRGEVGPLARIER